MTLGKTNIPIKTAIIIAITVSGWVLGVSGFIYSTIVGQNDRIAQTDKLTALTGKDVEHLQQKVEAIDDRTIRIEESVDKILRVYNLPRTEITAAKHEIMTRAATST